MGTGHQGIAGAVNGSRFGGLPDLRQTPQNPSLFKDLNSDKLLVRFAAKIPGRFVEIQHPLWDNTVDSLRPLLSPGRENGSQAIPIFLNRRREPITRFGVAYILRKHATRAQDAVPLLKNKKMHPHVFRHSTAVHLLQSGVDPITISHWLGHASVETTNRYAVIDLETKRKALELAGPLEIRTDDVDKKWKSDPSILKWLETL